MSLTTGLAGINLSAVLLAGLAHMVICLVWFAPGLFGRAWVQLTGAEMKPAVGWIPAGIVGHMAVALAMAVIVNLTGATTVLGGLYVAVLAWLGFVVTLEVGELLWEKIPFRLFAIRVANHLVALGVAGIILAVMR